MISLDSVMAAVTSYQPPSALAPDAVWPPRQSCSGWLGSPPSGLPYSRIDMERLLEVMARERILGGTVVLTRHDDGLANLFWGQLFERVVAFRQDRVADLPVVDGRYEIYFGDVDDGRFMFPLLPKLRDVRALVLDELRYNRLIAPYFLLRRAMRQGGIMIFTQAADTRVRRFLSDLENGLLDNQTHKIVGIAAEAGGAGMAYELVAPMTDPDMPSRRLPSAHRSAAAAAAVAPHPTDAAAGGHDNRAFTKSRTLKETNADNDVGAVQQPVPARADHERETVYLVVGNHRTMLGILEIIHTFAGCLAGKFNVKLSQQIKINCVNVFIDEFSVGSQEVAIKLTKERHPQTKIVIVATEFITSVSLLGMELTKTFNFFGSRSDWRNILRKVLLAPRGGVPPYMHLRYLGFMKVLKYCDLLVSVHPAIAANPAETGNSGVETPVMVYPVIGPLSATQQSRLRTLPVGFTMTGTLTRYRSRFARGLIRNFTRFGWFDPIYKYVPFDDTPPAISSVEEIQAQYDAVAPDYLFNLNPPANKNWRYCSPMRILRAILSGQVPVVTKKFGDHPIENIALLLDDTIESAQTLGAFTIRDRDEWLGNYIGALQAYDLDAREANKPLIEGIGRLVQDVRNKAT